MTLRQQIIVATISYAVIIYAISYLEVWMNPYWYDNSPNLEYIPVSERWVWALWGYLAYFGLGLPLLLATIAVMVCHSRR
ncbi:hypothetical protein [Chamaesiphon sp.]|uniref:hypothetical protein n=1 Tax=Chamaesiphon sp. TaxID=2814140 RepID=UPI003593C659